MKQILFLTRNLNEDKPLRKNLEDLGYEVFCSSLTLKKFFSPLEESPAVDFPIVFLSATITNENVTNLLKRLELSNKIIFRCDWVSPEDNLLTEWVSLGLADYLPMDVSLAVLRDTLAEHQTEQQALTYTYLDTVPSLNFSSLERAVATFSRSEKKLFDILYQENGEFISRGDVAYRMWNNSATTSNLAQLSQIVSRIRTKFGKMNLPEDLIETNWKQGYRLSKQLLQKKNNFFSHTVKSQIKM